MSRCELHVRDEGLPDGPALVLGPSLGSTAETWDPLMPELLAHFRVLRYDHWGHGRSPAPAGQGTMQALGEDLLRALDRLQVERAHVAGISLGGMVALWLAAHHPARVDRLCLICTAPRLVTRAAFLERAQLVRARGVPAVADAIVVRWVTPEFAAAHPERVQALAAMVGAADPAGYAACCEAIATWDGLDTLPGLAARTLVVTGAQDTAISPTYSALLADSIPDARLLTIQQAAHVPSIEQPGALARALRDHCLLDLPPAGPGPWPESLSARRAQGETVRRAVLGDAHVDRAKAAATAFTEPFQDLLHWYPWGSIWARPGLSRVERSLITLALLSALHHDAELAMHVRAALRNGLSPNKIQEVLLHTGVYAGIPVANRAFAIAQEVLRDAGLPAAGGGPDEPEG